MERFGLTALYGDAGDRCPVGSLVELIVSVSDESDDHWEIGDRVDAAIVGGRPQPLF